MRPVSARTSVYGFEDGALAGARQAIGFGGAAFPGQRAGMCRCTGGKDRARIAVFGDFRNGTRDGLGHGVNKQSRFIGDHGIGNAADCGRDAWQSSGGGLKID